MATQIDSLGHVTTGEDNHWYNGFTEAEWGGNFGIRKADASTIPPIVVRGILIDVAGNQGVEALKGGTAIGPKDLEAPWRSREPRSGPETPSSCAPGPCATGGKPAETIRSWRPTTRPGSTWRPPRWLVEEKGAIMVGSDTSGLEVGPAPAGSTSFIPVHEYLLVEQGVHVAEFHYLEDLAADRAYQFCYIAATNKIKGSTAGFTIAPSRCADPIHQGPQGEIHEGPRRSEGPRRGWRGIERGLARVGKGGADRREKELSGGDRPSAPWERGRPARTNPGTMEEIPVKAGSVRFAREWPWIGGCFQE